MALQSLESNAQLSFATRMEDWTCLAQHKRQPECPVVTRESRRNSRKTTWLPRHRKMKPFPATASHENRLPSPVFLGFPCGLSGKEFACNVGDLGLIPGLGRSPGEGKGHSLQYSALENSMDCIVHEVAELDTTEQLNNS